MKGWVFLKSRFVHWFMRYRLHGKWKFYSEDVIIPKRAVIGHLSSGNLSTSTVKSAKVDIKVVIISSYFGKNSWCIFAEMLNDFFLLRYQKVGLQVNVQLSRLKWPRRKILYKKH